MKKKTYEEFIAFYRKTGILDMGTCVRTPSKPLNERQLATAYSQYEQKLEKAKQKEKAVSPKGESEDSKLRKMIETRDGGRCRLMANLSLYDKSTLLSNSGGQHKMLDAAHVFGKGPFPHMRYVKENIVLLNRFSHNCLDTQKSPITGKPITAEEKEQWWCLIVGRESYEELKAISHNKDNLGGYNG